LLHIFHLVILKYSLKSKNILNIFNISILKGLIIKYFDLIYRKVFFSVKIPLFYRFNHYHFFFTIFSFSFKIKNKKFSWKSDAEFTSQGILKTNQII